MQWPFSNSLLMFQMAASVAMIYLASLLRLVETRPLTVRGAMSLWGVVFFYNANVGFALAAVQALSIPMYHVLKRLTPVMILLAKLVMGEPPPPIQITLSVCTVVAGALPAPRHTPPPVPCCRAPHHRWRTSANAQKVNHKGRLRR